MLICKHYVSAPLNFLLMSQTRFIARFIFQAPGSNLTIVPGRGKIGSKPKRYNPSPDAVLPLHGIQVSASVESKSLQQQHNLSSYFVNFVR